MAVRLAYHTVVSSRDALAMAGCTWGVVKRLVHIPTLPSIGYYSLFGAWSHHFRMASLSRRQAADLAGGIPQQCDATRHDTIYLREIASDERKRRGVYSVLPPTSEALAQLTLADIEPWYRELLVADLSQPTLQSWLTQWSRLSELIDEVLIKQEIACTQHTADQERADRKQRFLDEIYAHIQPLDQHLKLKLLASGLEPDRFAHPLRKLHTEAALFCEQNVPLRNAEEGLRTEYLRFSGSQTVIWEGQEVAITVLTPVLMESDRGRRQRAWRTIQSRRLADREKLCAHWQQELQIRQQIASNAGYETYREYR